MNNFLLKEFVNRENEVKAFDQVVRGKRPKWLFLVGGENGTGKSTLLDQFRHMARNHPVSWRDFNDNFSLHTFKTILEDTIRDLEVENFRQTRAEVRKLREETRDNRRVVGELINRPGINRVDLRSMLGEYFSKSDLITICFDLGIDHENFGEAKDVIIIGLVNKVIQTERVEELLQKLKAFRPNVGWQEIFYSTPADKAVSGPNAARLNVHEVDPLDNEANQDDIWATFVEELKDLAGRKPIILSYDSYECAEDDAQKWIRDMLDDLDHDRLTDVILLLAGEKSVQLTRTMEYYCEAFPLENFTYETVSKFLVDVQKLAPELVEDLWQKTAGHPKELTDEAIAAGATNFGPNI